MQAITYLVKCLGVRSKLLLTILLTVRFYYHQMFAASHLLLNAHMVSYYMLLSIMC